MLGGLGRFTFIFGAFKFVGRGAFCPTKEGIVTGGCVGTFPGRLIEVAFPGLLT